MARNKTFPMRVSDEEMALFEHMAAMEKLPVGTFIRRLVLFEAERRGMRPRRSDTDIAHDDPKYQPYP